MAYTKNTWADGDIVTSEKLNHMEEGIANAGTLVVRGFSYGEGGTITGTSDKTWQEIHDALSIGARVIVLMTFPNDGGFQELPFDSAYVRNGYYYATFGAATKSYLADTVSVDGYPARSE